MYKNKNEFLISIIDWLTLFQPHKTVWNEICLLMCAESITQQGLKYQCWKKQNNTYSNNQYLFCSCVTPVFLLIQFTQRPETLLLYCGLSARCWNPFAYTQSCAICPTIYSMYHIIYTIFTNLVKGFINPTTGQQHQISQCCRHV